MSSCEAELNAIREGSADAIYFRELLHELLESPLTKPSIVFNDNRPTLDIVEAGGKHAMTKHYKRRINFVKQLVNLGAIQLEAFAKGSFILLDEKMRYTVPSS